VNIPDVADVINGLAERYGLSTPVRDDVLFGMEGKSTLAGIVNGLSFAAQKLENIEARIDMETLAGAILIEPKNMQRKVLAIPREEYEPIG
jgi:hypothetical protein